MDSYLPMKDYDKQPLTFREQAELLRDRNLIIKDIEQCREKLSTVSYYRLSAYMYPYKKKENGVITDEFRDGITWENVYRLYAFDRKLRLLIFDSIERIEVAVRTQIIYQLSHKYGSHWQDRAEIFKSKNENSFNGKSSRGIDIYATIQQHIEAQERNSRKEDFLKHYYNTYSNPKNPPSWMCVETFYFSHLSLICERLKNRSDITKISKYFSLPPDVFCSWLHTINSIRNVCAHHARLWNRKLEVTPMPFELNSNNSYFPNTLQWIDNPKVVNRRKLYYFLCMVNYMLQTINLTSPFKSELKSLLSDYKDIVFLQDMGIPENWIEEKMWQ